MELEAYEPQLIEIIIEKLESSEYVDRASAVTVMAEYCSECGQEQTMRLVRQVQQPLAKGLAGAHYDIKVDYVASVG